ncbi:MAG: DNA polymerase III subunit delta' [Dehalococcoidia bacterium]|nr:DNA polymerase III subunit delta' [Dehalococcoidia bacterium]
MWKFVGQPRAVELLTHSLDYDRLSHAYLFTGPPHVGKMTLALKLAQALNCETGRQPCGECRSCKHIAAGSHPDVRIIARTAEPGAGEADLKKEIKIAQIRELQQTASLEPYEGRYRVFIINGAEHLNEESANCLLKTLEEPPQRVLIILVTTNERMLLPTVVSRCQRMELFPLSSGEIEQELVANRGVPVEKAELLSKLCRGGIGWAVTAALDDKVLEEHRQRLTQLRDLNEAAFEHRFEYAARLAAQFPKNRAVVEDTLRLWMDWWRDLLLVKAGCPESVVNTDEADELRRQADAYTLAQIRDFIGSIQASLKQLEQNANPRLALEVLMLNVPPAGQERVCI